MQNLLKIAIATLTASAAALATYQLLSTPPQPDPPLTMDSDLGAQVVEVADMGLNQLTIEVRGKDPGESGFSAVHLSRAEYQDIETYRSRLYAYIDWELNGASPQGRGAKSMVWAAYDSDLVEIHDAVCSRRIDMATSEEDSEYARWETGHNTSEVPNLASRPTVDWLAAGAVGYLDTDLQRSTALAFSRAAMSATYCPAR